GRLLIDRRVHPIEEELRFPGNHRIHPIPLTLKVSRHGTEVSAGAHNNRRVDFVIDNPPVALTLERDEGPIVEHTYLRPAKEEMVELTSPDGVADDARVGRFN